MTEGLRADVRAVLRLAIPIVAVQVGMMLMGVVDTIMLGRVSAQALAAGALGHFYTFTAMIASIGALMVLDPLVAQAVGAKDEDAAVRHSRHGLALGAVLFIPTAGVLAAAYPVLRFLGQPQEVLGDAAAFAMAAIPGALAWLWYVALRQTLQAHHQTGAIIKTVLLGNLLNAFFNWVLIFGNLGAPALGVAGASLATSIGRWLMLIALVAMEWELCGRIIRGAWGAIKWPDVRAMGLAGIATGIHAFTEAAAFGAAVIMVGWIGTEGLAAHEITINLASLTYMVPLGVSSAAAVLVGNAIGRADQQGAVRAAKASYLCGVGFMGISFLALQIVPGFFARLYTSDPVLIRLATTLIAIAGVFQLFDGVQGVSTGVLRGCGDTRIPAVLNFAGFIVVGLPLGYWLGLGRQLGAAGVWWGLVVGLAAVAAALASRVWWSLRRPTRRLELRASP